MANPGASFDAMEKEKSLQAEALSWDTSKAKPAQADVIPVIDLSEYFTSDDDCNPNALQNVATKFRFACEKVGFMCIIGHGVPPTEVQKTFEMVRRFHALPLEIKNDMRMDRPDIPVGGIGYLPIKNRKLPTRPVGNYNEAFIVKRDHTVTFDDNIWPPESVLPGFRAQVERYADLMEKLGRRLLPIYAVALGVEPNFFEEAFREPLFRLRMTHYPPVPEAESGHYGISPHVDTTFCTILSQDQAGLTVFHEPTQEWIQVPARENSFIVNTGELFRTWTNDRFLSVKHFANNNSEESISRYSIPFFLNANADYPMTCIPSCCSAENPPKYPTISYNQSQAIAQGE